MARIELLQFFSTFLRIIIFQTFSVNIRKFKEYVTLTICSQTGIAQTIKADLTESSLERVTGTPSMPLRCLTY